MLEEAWTGCRGHLGCSNRLEASPGPLCPNTYGAHPSDPFDSTSTYRHGKPLILVPVGSGAKAGQSRDPSSPSNLVCDLLDLSDELKKL